MGLKKVRPRFVRSFGTLSLILLGAMSCGSLGAAGAAFTLHPATPPSLAEPASLAEFPTVETTFADERTVEISLIQSASRTLTIEGSGVITSNTCLPQEAIVSGTVAYSVNEAPVLALATSIPMWRELHPGDRGADVEALQSALAALGTGVQVDGVLGYDTLEVIAGFYLGAGYPLEMLASLPSSRLLWLPTPSVVPTTCVMNVGDKLSGSTDYATVSGGLASARIALPSSFVPGPRVLSVDETVLEIDAHGAVAAADLQLITGVPGYQDAIRTTEPVPLTGVWSLAEPARAVSVPAAALSHIEGQEACVWNGSEGYAVTLLGSQLGQSIVKSATDTDLPTTVTINPRNIRTEC